MSLTCAKSFENVVFHFLFKQKISLPKDVAVNYKRFNFIENVLPIKPNINFDITRCLERKSPLSVNLDEVRRNLFELSSKEVAKCPFPLLHGEISVHQLVGELNPNDRVAAYLRICLLESSAGVNLAATLDFSNFKIKDILFAIGGQRYTESYSSSAEFHGLTGLGWIYDLDDITPDVKETIKSNAFSHTSFKSTNDIKTDELESLSQDTIEYIADATQDQALNTTWRDLRQKRLTASSFGFIIAAIKKDKYPASLFKNLLHQYDLSMVKSVQWGVEHEDSAKLDYERVTGRKVKSTGFWLHRTGILGASPDGLLGDGKGIVEFKCPYSIRNISVEEAIEANPKFYLKKNDDGVVFLHKDHAYYHQIQGQLHIIKKEYCDFCVWTPVADPYILRIYKDPEWEAYMHALISFYFKQFLPYVIGDSNPDTLLRNYHGSVAKIEHFVENAEKMRTDRKEKMKAKKSSLSDTGEFIFDISLPKLSESLVANIAILTSPTGDSPSRTWYKIRDNRLTSSSFHRVLSALERNHFAPSLFKSIMSEYYMKNTEVSKSIYGKKAEAIKAYEKDYGRVTPSGIWLDSSGVLGASVSGILADWDGIIDIRCLYKYRDAACIDEVFAQGDSNFHLKLDKMGNVTLNTSHRIFHQIQAALAFSNRSYCDIITYTDTILNVYRLQRQPEWVSNIPLLHRFYAEQLFPKLCEKWGYENVVRDLKQINEPL